MIVADDPVLREERAHLDVAERCLQGMRQAAADIGDYGVDALASESLGRVRAQRLKALAADPDAPPFFGRIDRDHERGKIETLHIGRRHIRDARGDPVVIDWRAPIARAFYRATPDDRMGVWLRRRFGDTYSSLAAVGAGIAGGYATLAAATVLYDLVSKPLALAIAAGIVADENGRDGGWLDRPRDAP
jgi:hypothetical protein